MLTFIFIVKIFSILNLSSKINGCLFISFCLAPVTCIIMIMYIILLDSVSTYSLLILTKLVYVFNKLWIRVYTQSWSWGYKAAIVPQQSWGVEPIVVQCWPTVCDVGPTLIHHWFNVSCLLGSCYFIPSRGMIDLVVWHQFIDHVDMSHVA